MPLGGQDDLTVTVKVEVLRNDQALREGYQHAFVFFEIRNICHG